MAATEADYHLHKSYWTRLESLSGEDSEDFHRLSVAVNWPHRPQDIGFLLQSGRGFIARDQIGRPLGAGMCFEYDPQAAMVGMMITHPKLQAGGLGREILSAITLGLEGRDLRLNATKSAWRLYRSAGFREIGSVVQYQGMCRSTDPVQPVSGLRLATPADFGAIAQLDHRVFGAARDKVLVQLLEGSQAYVIQTDGQVTGFAMCRPFGRGHLIGPLVGACDQDAIALADVFISQHQGGFMRLDTDACHGALGRYLNAAGLENYDTIVPMIKGQHFGPENADDHIYALASQALG